MARLKLIGSAITIVQVNIDYVGLRIVNVKRTLVPDSRGSTIAHAEINIVVLAMQIY